MADAGYHKFTYSVLYTPPLTEKKTHVNFQYRLFWCWLVLINVKMLVMTKKKFKFERLCWISKCWTKNEFSECRYQRSWLMFCDVRVCYRLMVVVVKAMHTANMHSILLQSLLSDVLMCLNCSELWWTHQLLMLWLLILRVLVFSELSAALPVIKWISFRCITF